MGRELYTAESDEAAALAAWLDTPPPTPLSPEAAPEFPAMSPCSPEH